MNASCAIGDSLLRSLVCGALALIVSLVAATLTLIASAFLVGICMQLYYGWEHELFVGAGMGILVFTFLFGVPLSLLIMAWSFSRVRGALTRRFGVAKPAI